MTMHLRQTLLFFLFLGTVGSAHGSFSYCSPDCIPYSWIAGSILGTAAGAGAGYAAGHHRGGRGKRGERGARGNGLEFDTQTEIAIQGTNLIEMDNTLTASIKVMPPTGGPLVETFFTGFGPPLAFEFAIPGPVRKVEGIYLVAIRIGSPSSTPTRLGSFNLNGIVFSTVPGFKDPATLQNWLPDEQTFLEVSFPTSP